MNNRTQGPAPAGQTAGATQGNLQTLREEPARGSERDPALADRPRDAWRDVLLNTLIPVMSVLAVAIAILALAQIQLS